MFLFVNGALSLLFLKNYQFRKIMDAQQEELVQAEKMSSLGILTSGLAHEINNPMNFISGSLNALNTLKEEYLKLDSESTPEKKKILERIDHVVDSAFEGVERATNLISKLKFFSNPGVKQKMLEVNLESIIQSVLRSIESKLPYNISLSTKIPGNLKVFCHEQQIRLVFTHIIRNAIDAFETKEDNQRESLEIIASRESINRHPFSKISFFNSGPTIPEDSLKHIFDPFFSSRDVGEGEGLGMALSYMIIKEHGGKMEVSNEDGKVRFDVFLPAWVEKIS